MTLNCPSPPLSFTRNLNWQFHITILAKSASKKLGVLRHLRPLFSPSQLLALYRGFICPCMEYGSHICGSSTHTDLLNKMMSKAFHFINSPLTDCLDSLSHQHIVASLSLFYCYFHADCSSDLGNCMPSSLRSLAALSFLLLLIPILFIFLMQVN